MKCRHCNAKTSNREPPVCFDCRGALWQMRRRLRSGREQTGRRPGLHVPRSATAPGTLLKKNVR